MRLLRRGARCHLPARARPFASHASAGSATAPPAAVTEWAAAWSTLRPIGILGGMGSFSTILYYQHVNRTDPSSPVEDPLPHMAAFMLAQVRHRLRLPSLPCSSLTAL